MRAEAQTLSQDRAIQQFRRHPRLVRLECGVQHYAWGDPEAIPALLGIDNPQRKPFAELWVGAHPDLPAQAVLDGARIPLDRLIGGAAAEILGERAVAKFGPELPFLFKILASKEPLSIQAHPNQQQAAAGFEREDREGISRHAHRRNYHDPHHKPELIAALTDFYAMRGFRPLEEIATALQVVPEFQRLAREFQGTKRSLIDLYAQVMHLEQSALDSLLDPLIARLTREDQEHPFTKAEREHWILRADQDFSRLGHKDRGIFAIYLLNLVHLRPGQAMYLPAGELHAYLEGTGVEIMANSNNVLRGGLTAKHVDPDELLRILTFDSRPAEILEPAPDPTNADLTIYRTPAEEFDLARVHVTEGHPYEADRHHGVRLLVVTHGSLSVTSDGEQQDFRSGESCLIPQGVAYWIACPGEAVFYQAFVPGF